MLLAALAACGRNSPAPAARVVLSPGSLSPVTLDGETRPARALTKEPLRLEIADAPRGAVLTCAVGVRPKPSGHMARAMVAHTLDTGAGGAQAPSAPAPSAPRRAPSVRGHYRIRFAGSAEKECDIAPGAPRWIAMRIPLSSGRGAVTVTLERGEGAEPGETPFLAEPAVVVSGTRDRRDAILVSIDTLRADHLGSYGSAAALTPHLDRLSRRAALFSEARTTASWTLPAHIGLLASRYGSELGAADPLSVPDRDAPTLASALREAGYLTWGRANHLLVSERYGFDRGFSVFRVRQGGSAAASVDEALHLWRAPADAPRFLFLHLFDPHWDYAPPPPWNDLGQSTPSADAGTRYRGSITGSVVSLTPYFEEDRPLAPEDLARVIDLYDGEIAAVDHALGRLFAGLARGEAPLLVVTSDHGEEFKDHGAMGHGMTLYEEELRVPLLISDGRAAALRADPVTLLDVAPTIAAALGVAIPSEWRGRDVAKPSPPDRLMLAETRLFHRDLASATTAGRKAIVRISGSDVTSQGFDLAVDAREQAPAPLPSDDALARSALWLRYAFPQRPSGEHRPEDIEALRALGYVQ